MTGRHEPDEPTTPDLHQQWAQQGLDGALEEICDLVGAYVTITDHGAPAWLRGRVVNGQSRYPSPPSWVQPGVLVEVDTTELDPDHKSVRPYDDRQKLTAEDQFVGNMLTRKKTQGPVWLRPPCGGRETTALGDVLRPAPRTAPQGGAW